MVNFGRQCDSCGVELVRGDLESRTALSKNMSVRIDGIKTTHCPKDCPGIYWASPDLRAEIMDLLSPGQPEIARRKGFLVCSQLCKGCGVRLDSFGRADFHLKGDASEGFPMTLSVSAQALVCPGCRKRWLPAKTSPWDGFYSELSGLIADALNSGLKV